jgi:hypothetical protein
MFDPTFVLDEWIATRQLSRRKLAALEEAHQRTLEALSPNCRLDIAGGIYCTETELPQGTYMPVVIAAVLDAVAPTNEAGSPDSTPCRTVETLELMEKHGLIRNKQVARCLASMGY